MLILIKAEVKSVWSASMLARSASVSTVAVINLPMWNLALINFGSSARISATRGVR
jgi:hypothetical protein